MKNDGPKLRLGVVGVGTMGQHHVRVLAQSPGVVLAGLYDPDADRAEEICRRHDCRSARSLDELLDRSDAVTIAAPTSLHAEIGEKCLKRGLHVLMEKPLAHSAEAGEPLVDLARKAGVVLMVGHIERYNPAIVKMFEMLGSKQEPIISMDFRRLAPFDGSRCLDVDVLHDLLIHDVDLALELADSPVARVSATGRPVFSGQNDVAHTLVEFENGTVAVFWTAKCSPKKMRTITVATRSRLITADTLDRSLTVCFAEQLPVMEDGICFMSDIKSADIPVSDEEPLRNEIQDFLRSVEQGSQPVVSGERALRCLRLLETVAECLRRPGSPAKKDG